MDSSDSSSDNESLDTVEESSSDKDRGDASVQRFSTDPAFGDSFVGRGSQASRDGDVGSELNFANIADSSFDPKAVGSSQLDPEVGMVFHSEDLAYLFYSKYAYRKGFSVRKGHLGRRKDGTIRNRVFLCSNEGARQKHATHFTKKPREAVRTNCMARIEYKVSRDGIWVVSKIIYEHNHPLVRPHKAHLLRSHRRLLLAHSDQIADSLENPVQTLEFPEEESRDAETIEFLLKDQSSYLHTNRMRELEKGNAQVLLEFLKSKQLEDPSFFYAIQLDDRELVTNFFWADSRSIIDYSYFGDVVLFDTTYSTNKSEIPFAPFIGINHHKQIVLFGSALLLDETTESYVWLFKTFMVAMSGRQPKSIFTDNSPALSRAISMILPETSHRLCLWHIIQNSAMHISHTYSSDASFQKDLKDCIYEDRSVEEFCSRWATFMHKYNLAGNSWIEDIYSARDRWALVYNIPFCAFMTTIQWGETMKSLFKKHLNRKLPLFKFLEQYHKSLIRFREKELYEDNKSRQTKPVLLVVTPMLNEAAESYTRMIYNEFQEEFKGQLSCLCEPLGTNGTVYTFKVTLPGKQQSFGIVELNPSTITVSCSCRKFERIGMLCMHTLKVLNNNNVLHLPAQYILKRWTIFANVEVIFEKNNLMAENNGQDPLGMQYSRVCHKAIAIAVKNAFSEDALQIFEQELDKLLVEVDHVLHLAPLSRQAEDDDVSNLDDNQQDALEGSKKKRGRKVRTKDADEAKRKKKPECTSNPMNTCNPNQLSQFKEKPRHHNVATNQLMVSEPSHVPSYHRDGTTSYCPMQMQVPGCTSFSQEAVIPAQESYTTSQGLFDHTMPPQGANDANMAWSAGRGSINVSLPVMQGQTNNFVSWMVQSRNISNMAISQHHLDQPIHSTIPVQHQSLNRKLTFDINKGN